MIHGPNNIELRDAFFDRHEAGTSNGHFSLSDGANAMIKDLRKLIRLLMYLIHID